MSYNRLNDMDFTGKKVLLRVDFNVPLDEECNITDDKRIKAVLPTCQYLIENQAKLIIVSHLGRPKGEVIDKLKMDPVAKKLSQLLKLPVKKLGESVGVEQNVDSRKEKDIVLLENVRFHKDETSKDDAERETFAKKLAALADIYVNDAFAVSHRKQASVTDVIKFIPGCAGFLLEKEIDYIGNAMVAAKKPFIAIIGGAKADKIDVIKNLLEKVDKLIIGGVLANTFLKARGVDIGSSKFDEETLQIADEILEVGKGKLILPSDVLVADKFEKNSATEAVDVEAIPKELIAVDIGPKTVQRYTDLLLGAKTIVWAGPVGAFEYFPEGTRGVAKALADSEATTIVGGGDSASAIKKLGFSDKITHVSTGGGASLEMFQGKKLPGIEALEKAYKG